MQYILENLVGTVFHAGIGLRALDSLSPKILASVWELADAATRFEQRARAENHPEQAKECDEVLQLALELSRDALDLAARPRRELEEAMREADPHLAEVVLAKCFPESVRLLSRVLLYNDRILDWLSRGHTPVFALDLNMLLNTVERLSASVPGMDLMLLLRSIAGEAATWASDSRYSEFKMLNRIPPGTETGGKADDAGREGEETEKYLRWVWSGATGHDLEALDAWQKAAWQNKQLNPSRKDPRRPHPAVQEDNEQSEIWFLVNGVVTDPWIAQLNAENLAEVFGRPVNVLHNPTEGLSRDLAECVAGRTFGQKTRVAERIARELVKHVTRKKSRGKIVVVAHSQGTIILSDVIRQLRESHAALVERMEVFNFAFCADYVPDGCVRQIEHYVNENDFVPSLSIVPKKAPSSPYEVPGRIYRRAGAWGHLLGAHYLEAFQAGCYVDAKGSHDSALWRYRDGDNYGA